MSAFRESGEAPAWRDDEHHAKVSYRGFWGTYDNSAA